jgi:hypothetical protein
VIAGYTGPPRGNTKDLGLSIQKHPKKKIFRAPQKICVYIFLFESLRGKFHMYMYCKKCRCRCVLRDLKESRGRAVSDSFKIGNV